MPLEITFELSDEDLDYFRSVMQVARKRAGELDENVIVENARSLIGDIWEAETSDFIRERMHRMETLIAMAQDTGWGLDQQERRRVLDALAYFSEPEDLIPDNTPGLGYLDDAIMIEMVCRELRHEIQAYRDYCVYRAASASKPAGDANSGWLEERRQQLQSRMRRRREKRG
jgi:uncharacterized membrane protein YkvA (DUF1232 family)